MKIDRKQLLALYKNEVDLIAEECDWVTHFGPEEIIELICYILEENPNLINHE